MMELDSSVMPTLSLAVLASSVTLLCVPSKLMANNDAWGKGVSWGLAICVAQGGHPILCSLGCGGWEGRRRPVGGGTRQRVLGGQLPWPRRPAPWLGRGQSFGPPDSPLAAALAAP